MKRFRGELVIKALRLLYHSTLGVRVVKKKKQKKKIVSRVWVLGEGGSLHHKLRQAGG